MREGSSSVPASTVNLTDYDRRRRYEQSRGARTGFLNLPDGDGRNGKEKWLKDYEGSRHNGEQLA